jgi:hypothetical protein
LASTFIERFPSVAAAGRAEDFAYPGWFSWLLYMTYPERLPIAAAEYMREHTRLSLIQLDSTDGGPLGIPLSPADAAEGKPFEC